MLVSDGPTKVEGAVLQEDLLATRLMRLVGRIETDFDGITPCFVPGAVGGKAFATPAARGGAVRMLTNALETTNLLQVHAGFAKRRMDKLRSGVDQL